MSKWKEAELNVLCTKITDGSHQSPKECVGGSPMFSVKDMENYGFNYSKVKTISEDDFNFLVRQGCKPNINDILIAKDGSVLKHIFKVKDEPNYVLLSSIAILRPKTELINPDYLVYALKSPIINDLILSNFVSGSGVPRIVLKDFKKVNISFPSLPEQERIAEVLLSLDDKIDLLQRNIKTLEQLAETLFRDWFVEKNDTSFTEGVLGDICSRIGSGGTPATKNKDNYNGNINWYSTKELNDSFVFNSISKITEQGLKRSSAKKFPKGTVVMAIYAAPTVGRLGILSNESTFNQAACGFVANEKSCTEFLYLFLKSQRDELNQLATGSAQQNLNVGKVRNYPLIIPSIEVMNKFKNQVYTLFNKIETNQLQIQQLETLRDTLLPKLMAGSVRVEN